MASVDDAFLTAQALAPADKLALISRLWETFPRAEWRPTDSDRAEVERRWAEFEAGMEKAIPWVEVRDEARRRLKSHD